MSLEGFSGAKLNLVEQSTEAVQDKNAEVLEQIPDEKLSEAGKDIRATLLSLKGEKAAKSNLTKLDMLFFQASKMGLNAKSITDVLESVEPEKVVAMREHLRDYGSLIGETPAMAVRQQELASSIANELVSLTSSDLQEAA